VGGETTGSTHLRAECDDIRMTVVCFLVSKGAHIHKGYVTSPLIINECTKHQNV